MFLGFGAVAAYAWPRASWPRALEIGTGGVRHDDPKGDRGFELRWEELGTARVSRAVKRTNAGLSADPVSRAVGRRLGDSTLVRIDLTPVDESAETAHAEMKRFRRRSTAGPVWRLPFGPRPELCEPVDAALRRFGGPRYRELLDEGTAWGFRYS